MKFSLTFWIADPDGMDNVKSDVMLSLWDAFKREGIRVPYPVREIRVRGGALPVETIVEVSDLSAAVPRRAQNPAAEFRNAANLGLR